MDLSLYTAVLVPASACDQFFQVQTASLHDLEKRHNFSALFVMGPLTHLSYRRHRCTVLKASCPGVLKGLSHDERGNRSTTQLKNVGAR